MAASKEQKDQAARLLAAGHSEIEVAGTVGVTRSTIQNWKRKDKFIEMIRNAQLAMSVSIAKEEADLGKSVRTVLENLDALRKEEAAVGKKLWSLFDRLEEKTLEILDSSDPEDYSPRQIPSLVKAKIELAQIGLTINDRIAGVGALIDGFKRIR